MNELSIYLPEILLAMSAVLLALLSPGPNILAVIGASMSVGRAEGAALALGVAFGSFLWALIAVLGLTALLAAYAGALIVIKIVGGGYLLWLGYKSLRSAFAVKDVSVNSALEHQSRMTFFLRGLTVQMTNPKAALAMTAIVTIGIQGQAPGWVGAALVAGVSLLSLLGHLIYALVFSTQAVVDVYAKSRRWVDAALGVFFVFAGIRLLGERT